MKKEEFILQEPNACKEGIEAFLAFEGTIEEYFTAHKRGADAYIWCLNNGWVCVPFLPQIAVIAHEGETLTLPTLSSVGRFLEAYDGAVVTLPSLESVDGCVEAYDGATIRIPRNCTVKGKIDGNVVFID